MGRTVKTLRGNLDIEQGNLAVKSTGVGRTMKHLEVEFVLSMVRTVASTAPANLLAATAATRQPGSLS